MITHEVDEDALCRLASRCRETAAAHRGPRAVSWIHSGIARLRLCSRGRRFTITEAMLRFAAAALCILAHSAFAAGPAFDIRAHGARATDWPKTPPPSSKPSTPRRGRAAERFTFPRAGTSAAPSISAATPRSTSRPAPSCSPAPTTPISTPTRSCPSSPSPTTRPPTFTTPSSPPKASTTSPSSAKAR